MILAAGLGTRLMPLTQDKPKALVLCNEKTLLEMAIEKLKASGISEVIINIHHFSNQITEYLSLNNNFGIQIALSDETDELLDSGGGMMKAQDFLSGNEAFLVWNVDVLSNISIPEMLKEFQQTETMALLAVRNRITSRYLLFDEKNSLCGWKNTKTDEVRMMKISDTLSSFAFSGIQMLHPDVFKFNSLCGKFSLTEMYLSLCKQFSIKAFLHDQDYWFDLGTPEAINKASHFLRSTTTY